MWYITHPMLSALPCTSCMCSIYFSCHLAAMSCLQDSFMAI